MAFLSAVLPLFEGFSVGDCAVQLDIQRCPFGKREKQWLAAEAQNTRLNWTLDGSSHTSEDQLKWPEGSPAEIEMLPISSPHHFVGVGSVVISQFMEIKEFHPLDVHVVLA